MRQRAPQEGPEAVADRGVGTGVAAGAGRWQPAVVSALLAADGPGPVPSGGPAGHAGLLALQRAAGNAAVAGRMPAGQLTVQRARLNVRSGGARAGTISGVSALPGRPTSNLSGTQGQHLTAYVVFEDSISNRVADRTPAEAARALITLLDEISELPGMAQANAAYLRDAVTASRGRLTAAATAGDTAAIGKEIDTILSIRNKVPGTAQRGTGGGHGEAGTSGVLQELEKQLRQGAWPAEWNETVVRDQARESMWRLLDYDPAQPADGVPTEEMRRRVLAHYLSLRSAYPMTWEWLTTKGYYLVDYLRANRNGPGMPLQRLSAATLQQLIDDVHANL
ncbi:hypothetical protein [Allostreptomyces psammosilenae]|uniref:Uncharacterized protein n=1 Tax=Allostreptomyces psammosilenae TaxID=1892865 RepID=A0A853A0G5_9ACTN|nr:hypothetical protein [Allostreptomyces psammosilenae]NYI07865.1 hypothetical protein [Allostreptomyces psammosilenae]